MAIADSDRDRSSVALRPSGSVTLREEGPNHMTERVLMRQVREILRLKFAQHLAHRAIARACGVGLGTVSEYCRRAQRAGPDVAAAARAGRRPAGSAPLPARGAARRRAAPAAGHGLGASGAQAPRRHAAAALARVPRASAGDGVSLQPVLPALPSLAARAGPHD